MLFVLISIVVVIFLCVEFESVRHFVAKIFFGTLAVAILVYGACALQNIARAEEFPDGFYYRVVFINEVENDEDELLIHTDDLDHLWDYWEDPEIEFEEFNKELSDIALWFVLENDLYAEFDKEEVLCKGRIIVLTMWEANPENYLDDEIVGVYYSELITR